MSSQRSLSDDVERIDENVNGLFAKVSDLVDRVDELEEELAEEKRKREAAESIAETALGVANSVDDGTRADGGPSKKQKAQLLSRNEAVRRALEGSGRGGAVTSSEVKSMALPETQLYHRSIRDAWDSVVTQWDGFRVDERDDYPDRLVVDRDDLDEDLVAVVERDLRRDDLTERLHRGEA